jgi:hypothetical protein
VTEQIVLTQPQRTDPRDVDRERMAAARCAAEELFKPKPQAPGETVPDARAPGEQPPRKPRILPVAPAVPVRAATAETPVRRKPPPAPKIPASQFVRIRTWMKYGMTMADVAQVYGVAVEEVERIFLAKA